MARGNDFVDECGPIVRPFLLENRDEDEVELVYEGSLGFEGFFGTRGLDDEADNEIANSCTRQLARLLRSLKETLTLTLLLWKNFPPGHDNIIKYLQAQVYNLSAYEAMLRWRGRTFRLWVCSFLQDLIDQ